MNQKINEAIKFLEALEKESEGLLHEFPGYLVLAFLMGSIDYDKNRINEVAHELRAKNYTDWEKLVNEAGDDCHIYASKDIEEFRSTLVRQIAQAEKLVQMIEDREAKGQEGK